MANTTSLAYLGGAVLGAAVTAIYTVPASTQAMIRALTLCNLGAAQTAVSLSIARAGGATQMLLDAMPLGTGANASYVVREAINQVMGPGDVLQASAANGNVQVVASGAIF